MATSVVLAKLLGPYCLIVALGVLLNLKTYQKVMEDCLKNSAIFYLAGLFSLIFGLLIIQFHNVWMFDWPIMITLMGWLGVVKGVWLIAFPKTISRTVGFYLKNPFSLVMSLIAALVIGSALTMFGYLIG